MAKNYMADVAKLLGVEMGEEFKLENHGDIYKFTEEGLMYCLMGNLGWRIAPFVLNDTLSGKYQVIRLPWKPKPNEVYYYVGWLEACGKWTICADRTQYLTSYDNDNLRVDTGNCFRTREEAEAAKYEVFKRLTGKDWNETYGKEGGNNATN